MFDYIVTFDRSNSCEIFSIVLDQCEQCGDRSCRSVRKEAQESEGGMWGGTKTLRTCAIIAMMIMMLMMMIALSVAWALRCVLPCEKLPRFCVSFLCSSLNDLLCWGFTSLHFTSSRCLPSLAAPPPRPFHYFIRLVSFSPFAVIRERLVRWLRNVPSSACSRNSFNFAHTEKETGIQSERGERKGEGEG